MVVLFLEPFHIVSPIHGGPDADPRHFQVRNAIPNGTAPARPARGALAAGNACAGAGGAAGSCTGAARGIWDPSGTLPGARQRVKAES